MIDPAGILALDLATTTGWAACGPAYRSITTLDASKRVAPPLDVVSGRYKIQHGWSIGPFLDDFCIWLEVKIGACKPRFLVFEAPILTRGTSVDTARKLMSLAAMTEFVAHRQQVPVVRECHVGQIKRHWTGNGVAGKDQMVECARMRGFRPSDDNEADALAVMDYAASIFWKPNAGKHDAAASAMDPTG